MHILRFSNGTEISSGGAENALQSVSLTESVNSGQELSPGAVCAALLEARLFTPAGGLTLTAGDTAELYEAEGDERTLLGTFVLEKPTRPSANCLAFTAYDFVSKLDRDLTAWLSALDGWPYPLKTFAERVCTACGLTLEAGELPNGDYLVQKFSGDGVTGRQLVSWAAQAAGRFCRARPDGTLEFAWYRQAQPVGPTGARFFYQGSLSYADYQCAPIQRVRIQRTSDDVGVSYPEGEDEANTYHVTGNYLLTGDGEGLLPVARGLFEVLSSIAYTPCKLSVPALLGLRAGDVVTVTDKNGAEFQTLVMTRTSGGLRDTLESTGSRRRDSTEALNSSSYRALSGRVFEVKKSLEGLKLYVAEQDAGLQEEVNRNSAAVEVLSDSIDATAERYQQDMDGIQRQFSELRQTAEGLEINIQSILENGVDSVTTKTGYTFNADGLDIHKAGEEIHNTIDNTGMYVRRGQGDAAVTMLQANADGVEATDLKARNYLIIGSHARFEDYENGRTACFYIG